MAISRLLISAILLGSVHSAIAFNGFGFDVDTYIDEAAKRYQIPREMLRGLVKMENGWTNNISPTGATGVGQFTFRTWNWLATMPEGKAIGMKPISQQTRGTYADPRLNKRVNTLATGLLARLHIQQFAERGIKSSDENLYMAHNIGLDGFHRALQGRANADDIRNMRRNGMKRWMSVNDFLTYQKNRYNSHKQIANAIPSKSLYSNDNKTFTAQNEVKRDIPKKTKSRMDDALTATKLPIQNVISSASQSYIKREQPKLRWIQPSDKQVVWVNPVQKL
ncbi:lytic transglycosylase domain-containing protein [Ursidibacter maritimus]|uniref:lytic transglycosylase domain-containing protein n=1 Tax=Ursidibacter maritimus TaxID=1331689 RepID=UPI0021D15743|nr:lytic transglycosylase domain-containing protein [Ursidibacter maritimus]MBV6540751.1 hypothetical protein [Ursidibacter maritimus]